jgi:hypothetical protein
MRLSVTPLVVSLLLAPVAVFGQANFAANSGHYVVSQGGKSVGSSDYSVQQTANGFAVNSRGQVKLTKFSYDFHNTQRLDSSLNLVSSQLGGNVNGSDVTFGVSTDSTGKQFQIHVSGKGKQSQNNVDRHQNLVLLTDLDASAYALLVQVAIKDPATSWALLPKQEGVLVPTTVFHGPNVRGTLNGSQVDVQHATITVSSANAIDVELFYTQQGKLLEADITQQNFSVALDGFKLLDHPQSAAPTAPPDKNKQGGQQQQQQQEPPQGGMPQQQ